jgi:hypothetical protein
MPSFTKETIEEWRDERVSDSKGLSKKVPLDDWQIKTMLQVCEEDLVEEERRLARALAQVKKSRSNVRSLKKKRENILKRKAEMENP